MNYELEDNILGALILKPELFKETVITDEYFLNPQNKLFFKVFKKQYEDCGTINVVGLISNYSDYFKPNFNEGQIISKVTELSADIPVISSKLYNYYQDSLFKKYINNQIMIAINSYKSGKMTQESLLDSIHKYEAMSIKVNDNKYSANEIYSIIHSNNKAIQFRFKKLSQIANIQEHDFVVIAARTGIGKSGFCLNLLEDISDRYKCLYFNMEIAEKQLYQRLVSINTEVPMKNLTNPQTDYQRDAIKAGCEAIANKNFKVINNTSSLTNIKRIIINESKSEHCVVFIDHVGLIKGQKGLSLYENTTAIVKELRQISLNYNCTIFLVSQLNRNSDAKSFPKLSDLRDSGEIEQSATTVIMLHDEHYENDISKNEIELTFIIAKNRNGAVGKTIYQYKKDSQRFDEKRY